MNILFAKDRFETSGAYSDNFLVSEQNVYLMDNHRLALWCFLQKLNESDFAQKINIMHIDAHPDLAEVSVDDLKTLAQLLKNHTLESYMNFKKEGDHTPLIKFDNYLTLFFELFKSNIHLNQTVSFTQKMGSMKRLSFDLTPIYLLKELEDRAEDKIFYNLDPWIINLDLDYFLSSQPHKILMYSEDYLFKIGQLLRRGLEQKTISLLTIAFSPECCGGYENALKCFRHINRGLKFNEKFDQFYIERSHL